ncbi:uncharacterized protein [Primulina huaijiensis]|uniref:uncharacterized protein n=1 Tax=Primulina huaijiensis TaxID=1492673 RepID=UPI003CC79A9D
MNPSLAPEQHKDLEILVWWDMFDCPLPAECNPCRIKDNTESSLRRLNYSGPISISAYGELDNMGEEALHSLQSSGVKMIHIPSGRGKGFAKHMILIPDMLIWGLRSRKRANHLLISGDEVFAYAMHQLKVRNFNTLLAHPHPQPLQADDSSLVYAANTVWLFTSLLDGEAPL